MIESIFIDNYRCFSAFEYKPGVVELIVGDNGTGKSALFEVLRGLKGILVDGRTTNEVFSKRDLSAWEDRLVQSFVLVIAQGNGRYRYALEVEHSAHDDANRISMETLSYDDRTLYKYDGRDAHLHVDSGTNGAIIPYDCSRSFIATIPERHDNRLLVKFRERMAHTFAFVPEPRAMFAESDVENPTPDATLSNLSAWLRHLFPEDLDMMQAMRSSLKETIFGLQNIRHEKTSARSRSLQFQFDFTENQDNGFWLPLDGLSDGQKQLVGLYAIQHALLKAEHTILIDEPDNYIAIRELQPWLIAAKDTAKDNNSQLLIISHNSELIDYLAPNHGVQFYREEGGPVRTKRFEWTEGEALRPSELIARGWV